MIDKSIFQIRFHYRLVFWQSNELKYIRVFQDIFRFFNLLTFLSKPFYFFLVLFSMGT